MEQNPGISYETSSEELSSSPPRQSESHDIEEFPHCTTTTDAIHPRFNSRYNLLFKCEFCGVSKAKESKIQKHFFENCIQLFNVPKYTCPLPECGGPSFVYKFKNEIRVYHSCSKWSKFLNNSPDTSILSLSSRASSSVSCMSSKIVNSSASSSTNLSNTASKNVSVNNSNGHLVVSSENRVTNNSINNEDFDV